ncbi:AraC-like DNA-binding protein [Oikeobacillus pervagus]|uniref:AraC-like DNA-binding protein n=1 Tax=Oikeobacillus pervagus TaxID=1325931 RepID=A0AAJ1T6F9_9BACI|nr:AraC family transcriptional regulator [Oikeobacillus pervagus]MDQ0216066.1 AraC-like DNA-binding protein [Oikeobacillus pervagus]
MYYVSLKEVHQEAAEMISEWIQKREQGQFQLVYNESIEQMHIKIVQIQTLFDWVKLNRMMKRESSIYFVLVEPQLSYSIPLAIKLQVEAVAIFPTKKATFLRRFQEVVRKLDQTTHETMQEKKEQTLQLMNQSDLNQPLKLHFLRRLLLEDVQCENQISESLKNFEGNDFPNVVCYVQGFHVNEDPSGHPKNTIHLIRSLFQKKFQSIVSSIYFLPFRKFLLILFHQHPDIHSMASWEEGRRHFQEVIHELWTNHQIQLYIGVGSIYNYPFMIHHSYKEAKIARSLPAFRDVSLRYFEEIPKDEQIVKCTYYIEDHLEEELTARDVAKYMNLSYTHFCRIFKKETGKTFSEYLSFVRLRRAVWMIRHTNRTIEDIAVDVGFNTPNYFSSTFKRYVGMTPRDYRLTTEIIFV